MKSQQIIRSKALSIILEKSLKNTRMYTAFMDVIDSGVYGAGTAISTCKCIWMIPLMQEDPIDAGPKATESSQDLTMLQPKGGIHT